MTFLTRWFGTEPDLAPPVEPAGPVRPGDASPEAGADRRRREVPPAERQVREAIAQKVLHAWLHNRHQTLMPLSVDLKRLVPADSVLVARFAALAALAGGDAHAPGRAQTWLASVGADQAALAAFSEALDDPPALPASLAQLARPDLAPLAFVAALAVARDCGPAARLFADYVAARLALPSAAIRSAERRYRA